MKFDTLEHGLDAFRPHSTISAEDLLYLMNLVNASLQMDNGISATECAIHDKEEFIEELAKQMYNIFFIAEPHQKVIEAEADEDLDEIREQLRQLDQEVERKKTELADIHEARAQKSSRQEEISELKRQREQEAGEIADLEHKIADLEIWLNAHPKSELEQKRAQLSELKNKAEAQRGQLEMLSAEITQTANQVEQLPIQIEEASQKCNTLRSEKEKEEASLNALDQEIADIEKWQKEHPASEVEQKKIQCSVLKISFEDQTKQLDELSREIEEHTPEVDALTRQVSAVKQQVSALQSEKAENQHQLEEQTMLKESLEKEIQESKKKQKEQNNLTELIRVDLTDEEKKLEQMTAEQQEAARRLSEKKEARTKLKAEIDALVDQISTYETDIRDKTRKIKEPGTGLIAARDRLQSEIQKAQQQIQRAQQEVSGLSDKLSGLHETFDATDEIRGELSKEVDDAVQNEKYRLDRIQEYLDDELKALSEELYETQSQIEQKNSALDQLKLQLTEKRSEHEELSRTVRSNNEEINRLQREISEYRNDLIGFEDPEQKKRELDAERNRLKTLAAGIQDLKRESAELNRETTELNAKQREAEREKELARKARMNFTPEMVSEWEANYTRAHNQLKKLESIYEALSQDGSVLYTDENQRNLLKNLGGALQMSLNTVQQVRISISEYRKSFNR